ncbi:unnamed protein product [Allacma fusca]|uniref:Cytochrome P450 n=1 Tax=Allacma fusca TaxID=39272 RepID=A0A8J2NTJ7_9HEXA|nr:unnamed protein product [Allacma fusca]
MITLTSLIITATFVTFLYYLFKGKSRPGKYPPGPKGIPILGSLLSISFKPHIRFGEWVKLYGNIFSVKVASYDFIIISDHKIAKEANNNPALLGKPDFALFNIFAKGNYGIFASHGQVWQEQRRFMLRNLRDFGFGKSTMRDLAVQEVNDYVSWLKSQESQSISLNRKFTLATINSLWMIMTGKRFSQNDPQITDFLDSTNRVFQDVLKSPIILFFPKLAQAFPKLFGWNKVQELVVKNLAFIEKPVNEHRKEYSPENTPRDFIDSYLSEVNKTTDPNSSFYKASGDHSLVVVLSDLFGAGSETTSSTLAWAIMYLTKCPETQKKLHQELDQVVGKSRQPTLDDRKDLPYTEAFILETLLGKRQCVGEQIARDSIFLFLTAIVQRFEITFDPEKPEPTMESSTQMFLQSDPYYVIMKDRNV